MLAAESGDEVVLAFLRAHPGIRSRIVSIARAVEDCAGDLKEADAAEERLFEEMRQLGREALQGWAETQVSRTEQAVRQQPRRYRQGEKNPLALEIWPNRGRRAAVQV